MPFDKENWFTEALDETGTAFSLKLKSKLHEEQTPYQKIEIFDTQTFGKLMVIDGCTMVSSRDNFLYHDMMAHPALFTHPAPRRVLIIGGGDCGTLREVLKHPEIKQAWQVDIDERVTRLSEKYFPELCESNQDPRAELHFSDGIQWLREAGHDSLDVIIVDSTDPIGPGEVLFTEEFYRHCRRALTHEGILVQQSESPLLHQDILLNMYQRMQAAGFSQQASLNFPQPIYPSGWWSATLAGNTDLQRFREQDVRQKTFDCRYYNAEIHKGALAVPEFMKKADKKHRIRNPAD
ncbi:MAG TPA: polyamine aminopropyltransferase [Gammaproteobacteria bacterium]|nr:polyamine aminopropyltransferase [Gammaproteobacteria bacterium]